MLQTYPGADGMKTGWIEASGHNLVTSAVHSGVRLIGVVLGAGSNGERDMHMAALLDQGFERMDVPAEGSRGIQVASRMPALIPTAQAAALSFAPARRRRASATCPMAASAGMQPTPSRAGACRSAPSRPSRRHEGGQPPAATPTAARSGSSRSLSRPVGLAGADRRPDRGGGAEALCRISRKRAACFVLRPESGQLASR